MQSASLSLKYSGAREGEEQIKSIERGLDDAKNGNVIPHDEVMRNLAQKFPQLKR